MNQNQNCFKNILLFFCFYAGCILFSHTALGDKITLKNGETHEGQVVGEDANEIYLQTRDNVVPLSKKEIKARKASPFKLPALKKKNPPSFSKNNNTPSLPKLPPQAFSLPSSTNYKAEGSPVQTSSSSSWNFSLETPSFGNSPHPSNTHVSSNPTNQELGEMFMKRMQAAAKADIEQYKDTLVMQNRMISMRNSFKTSHIELSDFMKKNRTNPLFSWALNMASESQAKATLRKLSAAATVYQVEHDRTPTEPSELIRAGYLEPDYDTTGLAEYRYQINGGDIPLVEAVPLNPELKLKKFSINSHGRLEEKP